MTGTANIAAGLGTYNDTPISLSGATNVTFPSTNDTFTGAAGPVTGSIVHATGTTSDFVLATGNYRVSYRVTVGVSLVGASGSTRLSLTQGAVTTTPGSSNSILGLSLIGLGAVSQDTVLVNVTAATGTLRLTFPGAVNISLGSASIEIEKIG